MFSITERKTYPVVSTLQKKIRQLKTTVAVTKSRSAAFKKRLKEAKNQYNVYNTGLRNEAINFCLSQLNRKVRKARGRRYSEEEKLMSLALYKSTGAGYRAFSKWFELPSKRTLRRMLNGISIGTGMNEFLMENLKQSTKHFKSRERFCLLLFDEIALMPHLDFNKNSDEIDGLVNGEIINHACVFMLRGITRKWKQTIAFEFCKGSIKTYQLKTLISTLIGTLKEIGNVFNINIVKSM